MTNQDNKNNNIKKENISKKDILLLFISAIIAIASGFAGSYLHIIFFEEDKIRLNYEIQSEFNERQKVKNELRNIRSLLHNYKTTYLKKGFKKATKTTMDSLDISISKLSALKTYFNTDSETQEHLEQSLDDLCHFSNILQRKLRTREFIERCKKDNNLPIKEKCNRAKKIFKKKNADLDENEKFLIDLIIIDAENFLNN